ncbi:hypothetical protein JXB02_04520 [Candidatus Woesearchaeota archaeon]|nr:hypothetical protein [Candidatus Woesearchaeota archaeon]
MDTFAHLLWTLLVFRRSDNLGLALAFGVLPDLASWGVTMVYGIAKRIPLGKPDLARVPRWSHVLYGLTHSVFVWAVVFVLLWAFSGRIPYYTLAWLLHLAIDIPTHSRDFLPTPFLWPLSDWAFPGISWGQKWFMGLNWGALTIAYAVTILPLSR